jgi:hypothetical protein
MGQEKAFSGLRRDLLTVIEQSRGESRSVCSLAELLNQTAEWLDRFHAFVAELETAERSHKAAIEFLETLDRIKLLVLSRGCLAPFRKSWQGCEEVVREHAGAGDLGAANAALLPFSKSWSAVAEQGPAMASHYHVASPAGLLTEVNTPAELAVQVEATATWMDELVVPTLTQLSAPELPDLPDASWTSVYPTSELATFVELQLATSRALAITPSHLLARISKLAIACSTHPGVWMTERESQTLASLFEQALAENTSWAILAAARDLFGDRLEAMVAPVIVRTASNRLWRLPGSFKTPDSYVLREKQLISRAVLRSPGDVSLVTRLHVTTYGEPLLPASESCTDLFSGLLELGSFGGWCFAAYLDLVEASIDEGLLQRYFTDPATGGFRYELALPLVRTRKLSYDVAGLTMLFAALELLFPPTVDLPYTAVWRVTSDGGNDIPQLRLMLEGLAVHGSGERQSALSSSGKEAELAVAEKAARDLLRPFRYRNRRSLAKAGTEFQMETAEPLLADARTAHDAADCRLLIDRLDESRKSLEDTLDATLKGDIHLDQIGKAKLIEHCERVLEAIAGYVREKQASVSRDGGSKPTRKGISSDLDRVATWGWAGKEASGLLRRLLVERTQVLPVHIWPGETVDLPAAAWLMPRCVDLWRNKSFDLAPYQQALEEDLRGPDPAHYAIMCAGECQVEWGREVLHHLQDVTPDLLKQFEDEKADWQGLVDNDRDELEREIHEQGLILSADEQELLETIKEAIHLEDFSGAEDHIAQLRRSLQDPSRTSAQRVATAQKIREEIDVLLDTMTADRFAERSVWRDSLAKLVEFSTQKVPAEAALAEAMHDHEVKQLQHDWEHLRVQILERTRPSAASSQMPTAASSPLAAPPPPAIALPPPAPPQVSLTARFGVIKKLATDHSRDFITAFDPELLDRTGDLYFERDWYDGNSMDLNVGSLVEIESISQAVVD